MSGQGWRREIEAEIIPTAAGRPPDDPSKLETRGTTVRLVYHALERSDSATSDNKMPSPPVTVTRTGPGFARVMADVKRLRNSDVLVGVPADRSARKGEPVTNSQLMFILSAGSPLRGIPARPTIQPAIEQNRKLISPELAQASQALIENKPVLAEKHLVRAGTIAVNATKRMFGSAQLAPNAPSTIRRKGSDKPLIDEGILRRSQTFVVRVIGRAPAESPKVD